MDILASSYDFIVARIDFMLFLWLDRGENWSRFFLKNIWLYASRCFVCLSVLLHECSVDP